MVAAFVLWSISSLPHGMEEGYCVSNQGSGGLKCAVTCLVGDICDTTPTHKFYLPPKDLLTS